MLCESKGNLESSFELTYQTKRQLTFIGFALRRFAAGIDYIIILPSIYFYLQSFGVGYYFLGLVIAADSLVAFFLSPLIEKLSERWQRVRLLGFLANLFQIGGSMVYALSLYYYMPLIGRLVSGIGQSFSSALYGEVKRVTTPEERNRVMIFMEGVRLFGVVIGPGMNFFMDRFDLSFGPWVIDQRTAPGFLMAIIWTIVEMVHLFTVYDLSRHPNAYQELPEHDVEADEEPAIVCEPKQTCDEDEPKAQDDATDEDEPKSDEDELISDENEPKSDEDGLKSDQDEPKQSDSEGKPDENIRIVEFDDGKSSPFVPVTPASRTGSTRKFGETPATNKSVCELLCRRDVILILLCQFLMFFNQTTFETLVILIGVKRLTFTINILSSIFIVAGIEMVIVIMVIWSANKTLDAKYLLVSSISAGILASFARLAVGFAEDNSTGCLVMNLLMGVFTILGTPTTSLAGKSLLPKLTPPETHGFYQSAFATSQHLGLVLGPLVASALYTHLVLFSSLAIGVFLVVYLLLLPSIEKMRFSAYGCGRH